MKCTASSGIFSLNNKSSLEHKKCIRKKKRYFFIYNVQRELKQVCLFVTFMPIHVDSTSSDNLRWKPNRVALYAIPTCT